MRASSWSAENGSGFSMEVRATGPDRVEVRFRDDDHTSDLRGSCRDGTIEAAPTESSLGGGDD